MEEHLPIKAEMYKETSFEKKAEKINLPIEEEQNIKGRKLLEKVLSSLADSNPITKTIKDILSVSEEMEQEVNEYKKNLLLSEYLAKTDNIENEIRKLLTLLTDPYGIIIFNKILQITQENPPDDILIKKLANVIKEIVNQGDYQRLFEKNKFVINEISKISGVGLIILINLRSSFKFELQTITAAGNNITNDWVPECSKSYVSKFHKDHLDWQYQIELTLRQLCSQGLVDATFRQGAIQGPFLVLTEAGKTISDYLL